MAGSSSPTELPQENIDDVLELNKDLEKIIEASENISVQLTWMGYDMVALRTSPELGMSMRKLEEAYRRCRGAVCGDREEAPDTGIQMENAEKSPEQAASTVCIDLEHILKGLDSLSNCMDQLALRTQLKLCDLIVCVGHPNKSAFPKIQEELKRQQPPARPETEA